MLKKVTLVLGLCALITACSESQDLEQVSGVADAVAPATGPLTVQAPDGVEIAATVHSVGEPTVVLVHGWMCDQTYWEIQVPALAEHFGVVNVDVAGHGLSGSGRQAWTIASLGDDVAAVIKHLNITRTVDVFVNVEGRDLGSVATEIEERLAASPEVSALMDEYGGRGYSYEIRGEVQTMRASFVEFAGGLVLAAVLVYYRSPG